MITLEQIRALDKKVETAVGMIRSLQDEKRALHGKLESYQVRIDELEALVGRFKEDQGKIEEGIVGAINKLDGIEDADPEPDAPDPSISVIPASNEAAVDTPTPPADDQVQAAETVPTPAVSTDDESHDEEPPGVAELDIF